MPPLLNVDTALTNILASITRLGHETVPLIQSLDRVIAEDTASPVSLPSFDNSAMDGYAIHAADSRAASETSPVSLTVVMDILAGAAPAGRLDKGQAARIMTGAPIPAGATAIIPVEDTDDNWRKGASSSPPARVSILRRVDEGAHIRRAGENVPAGATVMAAGTLIRPAELGMLAAIGRTEVKVIRKPKALIMTTGDELVDIDQPLAPGKIRDTNSYTVAGLIHQAGGIPVRLPIAGDSLDSIRKLYQTALDQQPDMLISSAGVSVGAADLVKVVMDELGDIRFWRINMRPGKPLAYGSIQGIPFFGLPGNPVSAMVTFEIFVRPSLAKMAGRRYQPQIIQAKIAADMQSDGRRSYNRVTLARIDGETVAQSTGIQSSGALMSMVLADGLAVIPEGARFVPAGTELSVILLRPFNQTYGRL